MRAGILFLPLACLAADWPQWRGPTGDGISPEKNLPLRWSRTDNIAWKAPLAGLGTSTPVIWGDHVFVTSQIGDGPFEGRSRDFENAVAAKRTGERKQTGFSVQAFDRRTGKLRWDYRFDAEGPLQPVHVKHNLASPSCVTDGERVYAWFGTGQLVVLDFAGKLVWKKHLGRDVAPFDVLWGHGSSPTLYKDSLFLLCEHPPGAHLIAVDRRTGKELWRADRGKERRSYTTPLVINADGKDQLLVNSTNRLEALDPANGQVLWHAGGEVKVPVPAPVYHNGVIYLNRGYTSSPYLAVRPGGKVEWEVNTGGPYVSSLTYYQGLLYLANERGIASVVDSKSGETLWRERLGSLFSASPVAADGHVYLSNEEGDTFVLKAGREKQIVAKNSLGERTLASPAISGGRIFLRTDDHLYCIGPE